MTYKVMRLVRQPALAPSSLRDPSRGGGQPAEAGGQNPQGEMEMGRKKLVGKYLRF